MKIRKTIGATIAALVLSFISTKICGEDFEKHMSNMAILILCNVIYNGWENE